MKSHRPRDFIKFLACDFVEFAAAPGEVFIYFERFLRHFLVCFRGSADEGEVLSRGDALMAITAVEADPQQEGRNGFCRSFLLRHGADPRGLLSSGKARSSNVGNPGVYAGD